MLDEGTFFLVVKHQSDKIEEKIYHANVVVVWANDDEILSVSVLDFFAEIRETSWRM